MARNIRKVFGIMLCVSGLISVLGTVLILMSEFACPMFVKRPLVGSINNDSTVIVTFSPSLISTVSFSSSVIPSWKSPDPSLFPTGEILRETGTSKTYSTIAFMSVSSEINCSTSVGSHTDLLSSIRPTRSTRYVLSPTRRSYSRDTRVLLLAVRDEFFSQQQRMPAVIRHTKATTETIPLHSTTVEQLDGFNAVLTPLLSTSVALTDGSGMKLKPSFTSSIPLQDGSEFALTPSLSTTIPISDGSEFVQSPSFTTTVGISDRSDTLSSEFSAFTSRWSLAVEPLQTNTNFLVEPSFTHSPSETIESSFHSQSGVPYSLESSLSRSTTIFSLSSSKIVQSTQASVELTSPTKVKRDDMLSSSITKKREAQMSSSLMIPETTPSTTESSSDVTTVESMVTSVKSSSSTTTMTTKAPTRMLNIPAWRFECKILEYNRLCVSLLDRQCVLMRRATPLKRTVVVRSYTSTEKFALVSEHRTVEKECSTYEKFTA